MSDLRVRTRAILVVAGVLNEEVGRFFLALVRRRECLEVAPVEIAFFRSDLFLVVVKDVAHRTRKFVLLVQIRLQLLLQGGLFPFLTLTACGVTVANHVQVFFDHLIVVVDLVLLRAVLLTGH